MVPILAVINTIAQLEQSIVQFAQRVVTILRTRYIYVSKLFVLEDFNTF